MPGSKKTNTAEKANEFFPSFFTTLGRYTPALKLFFASNEDEALSKIKMKKEGMPEQSDNLNHNNLPELDSRIGMNENAELLTKKGVNFYWTRESHPVLPIFTRGDIVNC